MPVITPKPTAPPRRAMIISTRGSSPTTPILVMGMPSLFATNLSAWSEGFPVRIIGVCDPAYRCGNGIRITHGLAASSGEKWHVRSHIKLRTIPDGFRGCLDIFHAAIGMPADVDCIDPVNTFVVSENCSDPHLCQRVPDAGGSQH